MDSKRNAKMKTSHGRALGTPFNACLSLQGCGMFEIVDKERLTFVLLPITSLIL